MPRLNFDITTEQHRQLKTLAAFSGMNMNEFVLSRVFAEASETVFTPRAKNIMDEQEVHNAQSILFKKAEVINFISRKMG